MAARWGQSILHRAVFVAETMFDRVRRRLRDRLGRRSALEVVPYRTYGTTERIELRGRVLVRRGRKEPQSSDTWIANVWRMVRRFLTYEMPGVEVEARLGTTTATAETDEEGYFRLHLPGTSASGWITATLEAERAAPAAAEVLIPPATSRLVIISDIDDTILPTGANRTATVLRTTLLGNARTRAPFPGIADFYRALVAGSSGEEGNPIFYVSSSPWNLYDFMVDFMDGYSLPAGPILLRDLGVDRHTFIQGRHEDHKLAEINQILATYPHLQVVLVGDIGRTRSGDLPDDRRVVPRSDSRRVSAGHRGGQRT